MINPLDVIKTTITVAGFVGAVVVGVYGYRKQRLIEGDAHRADAEQLAQRYTTAADQLGHEKPAVRWLVATLWPGLPTTGTSNVKFASTSYAPICACLTTSSTPPARNIREFSSGKVSFCDAEFTGSEVSFEDAKFTGSAIYFDGAKFTGTGSSIIWDPFEPRPPGLRYRGRSSDKEEVLCPSEGSAAVLS